MVGDERKVASAFGDDPLEERRVLLRKWAMKACRCHDHRGASGSERALVSRRIDALGTAGEDGDARPGKVVRQALGEPGPFASRMARPDDGDRRSPRQ